MRGLSPLLALAAGLVLAAPAAAADTTITFASYAYNPTPATVKTGDTATFSGSFSSHPLVWDNGAFATTNMGTARAFSFSQPGTYSYHCQLHGTTPEHGRHADRDRRPAPRPRRLRRQSRTARAGQPVTFTYTGDADPDGTLTSWQWDLDGDGSLETTTPAGSATKTYASPTTLTIRMRAIDDSGEPSATAEQAVTIEAAGPVLRRLGDHGHRGPAGDPRQAHRSQAPLPQLGARHRDGHPAGGRQDHRARQRQGRHDHDPPASHRRRPRAAAPRAQAARNVDAHPARRQWQRAKAHAQGDGAAPVGIPSTLGAVRGAKSITEGKESAAVGTLAVPRARVSAQLARLS